MFTTREQIYSLFASPFAYLHIFLFNGQWEKNWTSDFLFPKQVFYLAELLTDMDYCNGIEPF